jgi:hypothetical protein
LIGLRKEMPLTDEQPQLYWTPSSILKVAIISVLPSFGGQTEFFVPALTSAPWPIRRHGMW